MAHCLRLRKCLAWSITTLLIPGVAAAQSHVPAGCCLLPLLLCSSHSALRRFGGRIKHNKSEISVWSSTGVHWWVIRTGKKREACTREAASGCGCVLEAKADFLESLAAVRTSVTGWTLPASHRLGIFLYNPLASPQQDLQLLRRCFFFFFTCVSRWADSEQSIALSQQSRLITSWERRESDGWWKRGTQ